MMPGSFAMLALDILHFVSFICSEAALVLVGFIWSFGL